MSVKIEIGFTEAGNSAPFLTLDDPVKGVLDNTTFVLGGAEVLVDVTEGFQSFNISRGKSRDLDQFNAGQLSVVWNNNDRDFDPTFEASPYFGQIVPKRQIRVTVDDIIQFEGTIQDWNVEYNPNGNSNAIAQAFDGFSFLTNISTQETIATEEEFTGERIERLLDSFDWPDAKREVDLGGAILVDDTIEIDTNLLEYLRLASRSEPGDLFISKNGSVKFVSRNVSFQTGGLVFADDSSGIGYESIAVVFGSELLFNSVEVSSSVGVSTADNTESIGLYGERDLVRETLLSSQPQLDTLAQFLVNRFGEPEYRFEQLTIDLKTVTPAEREALLEAELGEVVQVKFTPNDIPPQVNQYAKIIGIQQGQNPSEEKIRLSLASVAGALFVLDDAVFGRLSTDNSLGW